MNEIQVFESTDFGNVRAVEYNGERRRTKPHEMHEKPAL